MPRLFAGFSLSDDARTEIVRVASAAALRGVSEVPPANLHVTLAFLGEVPDPDAVEGVLRASAGELAATETRLGVLGGFPSARRARVVWVSLADPTGALQRGAATLRQGLERGIGFEPDHAFVPHVTIARTRRGVRPLGVPPLDVEPVPFVISSVELFESVLRGSSPPRYVVRASIPFGGTSPSARFS